MKAEPGAAREVGRAVCVASGVLAIMCSTASLVRTEWTVERATNDWWTLTALGSIILGCTALGCSIVSYRRVHPRKTALTSLLAALLGVTVILALVSTHADVDLGTLPAWVSAGGALFTAGGVLVALQSYRATLRANLEDQANQVRLLGVSWLPNGTEHGKQQWRTEFKNRSDKPLYNIKIHGFRASVEENATSVLMRPITTIFLGNGEEQGHPLKVSDTAYCPELATGEGWRTLWESDDTDATSPSHHYTAIWYSVLDAHGRSWNIADNYEPTKISRSERPLP
ncbi:hypothetical protein [Rhodococcus erythropolis]|uniref:hypothetical protein n=1 Tax=Rhodococcus erythropolis TaxID=1833 RepID=UPI0008BA44DB|nr:hypothetical protein [Rhodococcus erythropolis]OFV75154.1 hypothetical protein RERY_43200 [Rhodococcus erythropolis]